MNNKRDQGIGRIGARVLAVLALVWSGAAFGIDVAGPISANTTWSLAQSPFRVTADVSIEGGATLTIEPGVTVAMEPGTNFLVSSGALRALGTPAAPIVFTSGTDAQGGTSSPGTWGLLRFLDGTNDSTTLLEYVQVRYGQGMRIESASPTLNYVAFINNGGPAISIDLNASPVGIGLQASGNAINGVSVPSGEVLGTVLWGLRGIPYVVGQGVVSVGIAPTVTAVSPSQIQQGQTLDVTVSGTRLAGADGLLFDDPALSATVLAGGSDTSFTARITAASSTPATSVGFSVQAAAGAARFAGSIQIIAQQPTVTAVNPSTLYTTQPDTVITVTGTNFVSESVVLLNNAALATTFVDVNTLTAVVPTQSSGVRSITVRTPDPGNAGQFFISNAVNLNVLVPSFSFSPTSLTLAVGGSGTVTLSIPYAASAGGIVAALSANASVVSVPASVTIPEGSSSTSVTVDAVTTTGGSTSVAATLSGFNSATAAVSVTAPPALILPSSAVVSAGQNRTLLLSLNAPAPAGGLTVALASSNTAVVTVPVSVTIPEGQTSISVSLTAVANGTATVTASANGYLSGSTTVGVTDVAVTMSLLNANSFATTVSAPEGQSATYQVRISQAAPTGGLTFNLVSGDTAVATVSPATITFSAGSTSATQTITITGVTQGNTTLTASSAGLNSSVLTVSTTPRTQLRFNPSTIWVGKGMRTNAGRVCRTLSGANFSAPTPLTVNLTSGDASTVTVPASVTIPANTACAQFNHTVGVELTLNGPTRVSATADGYLPPDIDLSVNVVTPVIQINNLIGSRNTLSQPDEFQLRFFVQNALYPAYNGAQTFDNRLQQLGAATTINFAVTDANPAGIVQVQDITGTTFTQATVSAGSSTPSFYVGRPTAAGSYSITVSIPTVAVAVSPVQNVRSAANARLVFSVPSTVVARGFRSHFAEIQVRRTFEDGTLLADADPITLTLASSDPTRAILPSTLTIPGGVASNSFAITGLELTGATPLIVDATAAGYLAPVDKLSVSVIPPPLEFAGLALQRSTLSPPSRNGFTVRVNVAGSPNPLSQVATSQLTVNLSVTNANPSGIVQLFDSSSGGNIVTQATICNGCASTPTRYVSEPSGAGSYTITAEIPGLATATSPIVTVTGSPARLQFDGLTQTVARGFVTTATISRTPYPGVSYSFAEPLTVTLVSSDPTRVSVPEIVTIPAGTASGQFEIRGLELTGSTPATISASAEGLDPSAPVTVHVVGPALTIIDLAVIRFRNNVLDSFCVRGGVVPVGSTSFVALDPISPITVDLNVTNPSPPDIVSILDSAGNPITQATLTSSLSCGLSVSAPTATGTYQITVSAPGFTSFTSSTQTVRNAGTFTFSRSSLTVPTDTTAAGAVFLQRVAGASGSVDFSTPLTVSLTSSDPARVSVPATVTIPAFNTGVSLSITGIAPTGDNPVLITASAVNFDPPSIPLSVDVVEQRFTMSGFAGTYSTGGSTREFFFTSIDRPSGTAGSYIAAAPITLDLAAIDIGANLARNGIARASSLAPLDCNSDGCFPASASPSAVLDGQRRAGTPTFRTNAEVHAWWEVDLGSEQAIDRIHVHFPFSTPQVAVLLAAQPFVESDFAGPTLPLNYSNGATVVRTTTGLEISGSLDIVGSFTGRYLRVVTLASDEWVLSLREVEVFQGGGGPSSVVTFYTGSTGGDPVTQITIPASQSGVSAFIGTPTGVGNFIIRARRGGVDVAESTSLIAHAPVQRFALSGSDFEGVYFTGVGLVDSFTVVRLLDDQELSSAPSVSVNVQCADSAICSVVVPSVTIAEGESAATISVSGNGVGTTELIVSAPGYETTRASIDILASEFSFSTTTVPQGESSSILSVGVTVRSFRERNVPNDTTINLVSSNPDILQVPASVVIPAGSDGVSVPLTGLASGIVTVTVSAPGFTPLTETISVQ